MGNEQQKTTSSSNVAVVNPFGRVSFAWPKYDTVYPDARGGGKSYKMLTFAVPFVGCGLVVDGAIYMRLKTTDTGYEITAGASLPKQLSGNKADSDAFLAHVENSAIRWAEYESAWAAAEAKLTGAKVDKPKGIMSRPDMAPRLVKQLAPVAPVAAPVN